MKSNTPSVSNSPPQICCQMELNSLPILTPIFFVTWYSWLRCHHSLQTCQQLSKDDSNCHSDIQLLQTSWRETSVRHVQFKNHLEGTFSNESIAPGHDRRQSSLIRSRSLLVHDQRLLMLAETLVSDSPFSTKKGS